MRGCGSTVQGRLSPQAASSQGISWAGLWEAPLPGSQAVALSLQWPWQLSQIEMYTLRMGATLT